MMILVFNFNFNFNVKLLCFFIGIIVVIKVIFRKGTRVDKVGMEWKVMDSLIGLLQS